MERLNLPYKDLAEQLLCTGLTSPPELTPLLAPIFLTRDQRVKAHITVCVLAYFLYNDMEQRLKADNINISAGEILRLFDECKINRLLFKQTNQYHLSITEPSAQQKEVLGSINLRIRYRAKACQPSLKKG